MRTFTFNNPTRLHFGAGQLDKLAAEAKRYGKNVLLVYGGGSIKKNGLYDQVLAKLNEAGCTVTELGGVDPNPRITSVYRGAELCRTHQIDLVLAVGGGSTIDCAKAIAAAAKFDGDFWDVIVKKATVQDALPLGSVLTLAATGSEMNGSSVISNAETKEKHGWGSIHVYPAFSILDPAFTVTVPRDQTVYGIVDMMSHVFETYFNKDSNIPVQDGFCETILRTVIATAPKLVDDLTNLEHRETILYCGTMALNGVVSMGIAGDWANHDMEHAVSAVYDIPHGGGLAILFPNWMNYVVEDNVDRFRQFAVNVFGVTAEGRSDLEVAKEGIQRLRDFWNSIGAPSRLAEYDIDDSQLEKMALMVSGETGSRGTFRKLKKEDVLEIYRMSL